MKLSCSAYQAGSCSYAQKILGHPQQNYGATSSTNLSGDSSHGIVMPTWNVEEIEGKCSPNETEFGAEGGYQQQGASGSGGPSRPSGDSGGTSRGDEESRRTSSSLSHHSDGRGGPGGKGNQSDTSISKAHATSSCSPSDSPAHRLSEHSRSRSKSVGEQQWTNLRAVMAWYARLRRIKRSKSNQRWMKLRTTVQLSGAIQTIQQKKAPLKREDSFLKRFSTRQGPEAQETFEIGDEEEDEGVAGTESSKKARKRRRHPPRSIINPDGTLFFRWLMLVTVTVLYNMWTLIVRQSFPELQAEASTFWRTMDIVSDVVYILDIAVQFRTGYLEQGLMVYQTKKLAKHYVYSRPFLLDVGSLCPIDLLQLYFGTNPMLRFPRFLKVYRIYNYYYMVESRTVFPNVWRVVNLIHILLLLAHWFGCFYYLLSEAEGFHGHWGYPNPNNFEDFAPLTRKYLGSLYWSTLTLTTIGDLPPPNTNWQNGTSNVTIVTGKQSSQSYKSRLHYLPNNKAFFSLVSITATASKNLYVFTIVSYLIGVFIFATIVGQVGNVITNRNANRLEFERLLDGAKTYMRHHKVPRGMQRRVLRWYDYSWSRGRIQGGGDINTALGLLPDKLKTELALHVNLSVLKKVTIFQECQPEFLHDLVLKMKAYIFTPGDLICRKGEVAREMFIIADGILEVISDTGRILTSMKAGDFFGEIGILNLDGLNKRTADVRSVGYSELFSLSREDVLTAMKDYPEAQEILQTLGRKRLMEARKASSAPKKTTETKQHSSPIKKALTQSMSSYSQKEMEGGGGPGGLVDKLKNDMKTLRSAIRKSRRSNSSKEDDSSDPESGKLDGGGPSKRKESSAKSFPPARGVLKRMHNVVISDEKDPVSPSSPPPTIPFKPSLLIKRVKLPRTPSQQAPQPEPEVIGQGLPLIQRLRLLRQKEERERKDQDARDALIKTLIPSNLSLSSPSASPIMQTKASIETSAPREMSTVPGRGSVSSMDGTASSSPTAIHILGTFSPKSILIGEAAAAAALKVTKSEGTGSFPPVWTASPPPSLPPPSSEDQQETEALDDEEPSTSSDPRPSALQLRQAMMSKTYGSVDDLSPEFSRLPFIQKLKILNERQKMTDLLLTKTGNSVLTRSTSEGNENVDIGTDKQLHSVQYARRTQSHTEQIGYEGKVDLQEGIASKEPHPSTSSSSKRYNRRLRKKKRNRGAGVNESESESSPSPPQSQEEVEDRDHDETPERRNLKSILKKLGAGEEGGSCDENLLKAQTVEGFAARHLRPEETQGVEGLLLTTVTQTMTTTAAVMESSRAISPEKPKKTLTTLLGSKESTSTSRATTISTRPILQEQYIGTVLMEMKSMIQSKIEEIQTQFETRFDSLREELQRRDQAIYLLQKELQIHSRVGDEDLRLRTPHYNHIGHVADAEGEVLEYDRMHHLQPPPTSSSYLFGRGDSIDTVVGPHDLEDDEVFEQEASSSQRRQEGSRGLGGEKFPTWSGHGQQIEMRDMANKDWKLEFHRDKDSLPPPNSHEVALDIGNSTDFESSGDEDVIDPSEVPLTERKIPLDDDDDDEEEEDEEASESVEERDTFDNKNWEIQLLAKEMEKREEQKKAPTQNTAVVYEMRQLENEIQEMKDAVTKGELSPSELDSLEVLLQSKTKRLKTVFKAMSMESARPETMQPEESQKSKVRSCDTIQRDTFPTGGEKSKAEGGFLDVTRLFHRGEGKMKRQGSLYGERSKGILSTSDSRRKSDAGAIATVPRKQSFLSRIGVVRQTTKHGKKSLEEDPSPQAGVTEGSSSGVQQESSGGAGEPDTAGESSGRKDSLDKSTDKGADERRPLLH